MSRRFPQVGQTPFNPSILGNGLLLWLRADLGVTTGSTFTWADQSPSAANAVQTTVSNQPSVVSAGINHLPSIAFNASGPNFLSNTSLVVSAQPFTIYVVAQLTDQTTDRSAFTVGGANIGFIDSTSSTLMRGTFNAAQITATFSASSPAAYSMTVNGASSALRINGSSTSGSLGAGGFTGYTVGAKAGGAALPWDKWVSEVIVTSSAVDVRVLSYLSLRYGVIA